MVDFIYLILCILSLVNVNIKGINSFFYDYIDLPSTKSIKGIFVWMIFFRHYTGYLNKNSINNKVSIMIDRFLNQNIVSIKSVYYIFVMYHLLCAWPVAFYALYGSGAG